MELLTGAPAAELARSFRFIRPSLSDIGADRPAVCARCLLEFLDALGVDRAVIIADPQFATLTELVLAQQPDRVERAVLAPAPLTAATLAALIDSIAISA